MCSSQGMHSCADQPARLCHTVSSAPHSEPTSTNEVEIFLRDRGVSGHHEAFIRLPVEPCNHESGFSGDEATGGPIPGLQTLLDERVEAPGGDLAQVEGGRSGTADVTHLRQQLADGRGLPDPDLRDVVEAGADEQLGDGRWVRSDEPMALAAVQTPRTLAAHRRPLL